MRIRWLKFKEFSVQTRGGFDAVELKRVLFLCCRTCEPRYRHSNFERRWDAAGAKYAGFPVIIRFGGCLDKETSRLLCGTSSSRLQCGQSSSIPRSLLQRKASAKANQPWRPSISSRAAPLHRRCLLGVMQLLRLFSTMPMLFSCGPFRLDSWGAPFRGLASCSCSRSREPRTELSARVKGDRALRPSLLAVVTDQSSYL